MDFHRLVELAAQIIEAAGVLTILFGVVVALVIALVRSARARRGGSSLYRHYRQTLGRAILLGLELLVAADIIRTVSQMPTLTDALILGLIVLIRTFLSFTLEVELEGRWPWQRSDQRTEAPPHES